MTKLYIYAAIFFTLAGLFIWVWSDRYNAGYNAAAVEYEQAKSQAVTDAIKQERKKQDQANEITRNQIDRLNSINASLNSDIEQLRERAERASQPENAGASCKGVTGAELSRPDAEFLTREAARADRIREGLKSCYDYADAVAK